MCVSSAVPRTTHTRTNAHTPHAHRSCLTEALLPDDTTRHVSVCAHDTVDRCVPLRRRACGRAATVLPPDSAHRRDTTAAAMPIKHAKGFLELQPRLGWQHRAGASHRELNADARYHCARTQRTGRRSGGRSLGGGRERGGARARKQKSACRYHGASAGISSCRIFIAECTSASRATSRAVLISGWRR